MILTCPACQTRYQIADDAVDPVVGREVECASCGHRWHYTPASAAPPPRVEPVSTSPVGAPLAAPRLEPRPVIATPRPEPAALPPPAPRRRGGGFGCLVLLLIVAALAALAVVARDRIVAMWPSAAQAYRAIGVKLEPLGAGLEIAKVAPTRSADALTIEGDITNTTSSPHTVPKLRVALRDAYQKELTSKIIDPPVTRLLPGETVHFKTPFEHPSDAATDVAVTFTEGP